MYTLPGIFTVQVAQPCMTPKEKVLISTDS